MKVPRPHLFPLASLVALVLWAAGPPRSVATDLQDARQRQLSGQANDGSSQVVLTLRPPDGLAGLQRSVPVGDDGAFSAPLKLFPGPNTIEVDSAAGRQTRRVEVNVAAPSIRVELTWAGQHQDYDLYCNGVFYGNKDTEGGHLDRDIINQQEPATENITFDRAAAGTYRIFVNYYTPHTLDANGDPLTDPETGATVPNPVPTTLRVFVNDQQVFSETRTVAKPERGINDGRGTWSVCTLVVHSGDRTGGYQVDGDGFRDLLPQKSVLNRINPRTPFAVDNLQGPGGGDVYLLVGQSAQFIASGSINLDTENQQNGVNLIGQFATTNAGVASIDEMGVLTALAPGDVTITAGDDSGSFAPGASFSTNQGGAQTSQAGANAVQAHVVDVALTQSNHPDGVNTPITQGGTALITAEPRMPQLVAALAGTPPPGRNVTWTLTTAYARRGTRDNKTFGPATLPVTQPWDIGAAFGTQFCGGAATLTCQIQGMPKRSLSFNIRGLNPLDADAKSYIISRQGEYPFAWAVAQHESRSYVTRKAADTVYNQFNPPEARTGPREPNFGPPDGWGLFQRDPTGGGLPAITDEVWSWKINTTRFIEELGTKKPIAERFFGMVRATYEPKGTWEPPPASFVPPGCTTAISAMDAAILTLYNGVADCPSSDLIDPTTGKVRTIQWCWVFDENAPSGSRWKFHRNRFNYVYKVVHDEIEGGLPFVE